MDRNTCKITFSQTHTDACGRAHEHTYKDTHTRARAHVNRKSKQTLRHSACGGASFHGDSELASFISFHDPQLTLFWRLSSALASINADRQAVFPPNISAVKPSYVHVKAVRHWAGVGDIASRGLRTSIPCTMSKHSTHLILEVYFCLGLDQRRQAGSVSFTSRNQQCCVTTLHACCLLYTSPSPRD